MDNVSFSGDDAGGSFTNGTVTYSNNTMDNVSFSGDDAGGSVDGNVSYTGNSIVSDNYDTDSDGLGDGYELFERGTNPREL